MTSKNENSIGEAIREFLHSYSLENKFDQTNLILHWENLMGKPIARRTKKIFIKDGKLFLGISSAPLKHEIHGSKSKVIELLNQSAGRELIKDIIFI